MSIRTTVTLDDDVLDKVKRESRARGLTFRDTLNDLLRLALLQSETDRPRRKLTIRPLATGLREGLNLDDIESLLTYAEGDWHR